MGVGHPLASSPTTIYANEAAGDYCCTYVSANLCALTGYEPRHMQADPRFWFERVHPEDRARVLAHCSDPAKLHRQRLWRICSVQAVSRPRNAWR
jgi:PAS domain-containing protein